MDCRGTLSTANVVPDVCVDCVDACGHVLDGEGDAAVEAHRLAVRRRHRRVQPGHPAERHLGLLLKKAARTGNNL